MVEMGVSKGQVAKYNYSLRSNSAKHFLPDLTRFCIRNNKNIVPADSISTERAQARSYHLY